MSTYKRLPTKKTNARDVRGVATVLDRCRRLLENNWKKFALTVGSAAVLAGIIVLVVSFVSNRGEQARNLYFEAVQLQANNNEGGAIKGFEKVISEYPSTTAGYLSRLKLSDIYFANKDFENAEKLLNETLKSSEQLIKVLALNSLAACKAAAGQPKEAADFYLKAFSDKKNPSRGISYFNAGLSYVKAGETSSAKEIFEELSKDETEYSDPELKEKSKEQLIWLAAQAK